jgi:hypothetical protein
VDSIVLGLAGIAIGALVAGFGVRVFYLLLPLWGFVSGVLLGAEAVTALAGDGVFATLLSWAIGIGTGLLFAAVAALWFWAAVIILALGAGAALGSGVLVGIGIEPGLLTFLAGLATGVAFAAVAYVLDAPTLLVALLTSYGGAAYGIAGAYVLIGRVAIADLADGPLAPLREHPLGLLAWLGLGTLALAYQLMDARGRRVPLLATLPRSGT